MAKQMKQDTPLVPRKRRLHFYLVLRTGDYSCRIDSAPGTGHHLQEAGQHHENQTSYCAYGPVRVIYSSGHGIWHGRSPAGRISAAHEYDEYAAGQHGSFPDESSDDEPGRYAAGTDEPE